MSHSSTVQAAFATLELSSSATQDEVKAKYKKLALQCHPDKNPEDPNATLRFQRLGQAYNELNRHFERRDQPSYGGPYGSSGPFGYGSPFGFNAYNSFNMGGRGGHGPDCSCGMDDESDDGYYDDGDEDDDMDFFMFIFAEMMRGRGRSYRKQRKTKEETPEEFAERVRRAREADEVNKQRRAQQEAARKERLQKEAEEESRRAIERKKTKAAKKSAARAKSQQDAKAKAELAAMKRQELRSATFAAARAGDAAGVRKGVWDNSVDSSGPELIQLQDGGGGAGKETLLHIAASLKDLELVEWLINHSAEPEEKDGNGHTVFHRALAEGAPEILKYLFNTYEPVTDYTAIFGAPKGDSVIRLAVSSGNAACVYAVLDAGLVEITDLNGAWEYLQESNVPDTSPWKAVRQALLDVNDWTPPSAVPTTPPTEYSPTSIPPALFANASSSTKKKRSDGPNHSKSNSRPRQSQNAGNQTPQRQPHTSPSARQNSTSLLRVPMGVATNDPPRKSKGKKRDNDNKPAKAPVSV